jgi:hypothetical protein
MDYNRVFLVGEGGCGRGVDLSALSGELDHAVRSFVGGVRDGTPFETDRKDNLETMRLMESVYLAPGSR